MIKGRKEVSEQEDNDVLFLSDTGFSGEQFLNVTLLKPFCWNIPDQTGFFIRKGCGDLVGLINWSTGHRGQGTVWLNIDKIKLKNK